VPGSFDGFPTATCVDAGLRKTAIFCTDELGLNTKFADREELVIIPHDAGQVTSILEYYYQHPEEIRSIAERGSRRIKQLYSYEAQILPRINLLRREIQHAGQSQEEIQRTLSARRKKSSRSEVTFGLLAGLKKRTPTWVMSLLRRGVHVLRSSKRLLALLKRVLPAPLLRFLARLRDAD